LFTKIKYAALFGKAFLAEGGAIPALQPRFGIKTYEVAHSHGSAGFP
jgi:hypothetical protein